MKGYLVTNEFEVGHNPWHFSVHKDTLYVPEAQLKIYHWQDRRAYGLVERLDQQEFGDVRSFHAQDIQEVQLDEVVVREISALFDQVEPVVPALMDIWRRVHRLQK